jgi:hypothetical protein
LCLVGRDQAVTFEPLQGRVDLPDVERPTHLESRENSTMDMIPIACSLDAGEARERWQDWQSLARTPAKGGTLCS